MSSNHPTDAEAREKVLKLIKGARIAMVATQHDDGTMHARPMATNTAEFDGTLWFLTDARSEKAADLDRHSKVLVTYSDEGKQNYVSVSGTARIVRERARVKALWAEPARVWFPDGPDDPNLVALCVDVDTVHYWDSPSGLAVLAYGYAKAVLTGERPDRMGEEDVVRF